MLLSQTDGFSPISVESDGGYIAEGNSVYMHTS